MSPPIPPRVYSLLRSARPAGTKNLVIGLVVAAFALGALGVMRVARRHEVVQLGFELSSKTDELRKLSDENRALELERSTLADPRRIRALAAALGMMSVPPDAIRIVPAAPRPRVTDPDGPTASVGPEAMR
jgi:cell division protein FtsL